MSNVWAFIVRQSVVEGESRARAGPRLVYTATTLVWVLRRTTFLGFGQPVAARVWSHGWEDQQMSVDARHSFLFSGKADSPPSPQAAHCSGSSSHIVSVSPRRVLGCQRQRMGHS